METAEDQLNLLKKYDYIKSIKKIDNTTYIDIKKINDKQ